MRASKEEWLEQQKDLHNESGYQTNNDRWYKDISGMLKQASVKSERLTNSEEWDYYLSLLSEWVYKTNAHAEQLRSALESPDFVNIEKRRQAENYLMISNDRVNVLEAVMDIPKQIMDGDRQVELHLRDIKPINNA